jgi:hypothetical protein
MDVEGRPTSVSQFVVRSFYFLFSFKLTSIWTEALKLLPVYELRNYKILKLNSAAESTAESETCIRLQSIRYHNTAACRRVAK